MIPIVPVMDSSNSFELLKKMMGEEWLEKLNTAYLKKICLYIRDYRMLKNIFNEYQLYYQTLRMEEYLYNPMKLFAMITYKNIWPKDFAELQHGKGAVYYMVSYISDTIKIKYNFLMYCYVMNSQSVTDSNKNFFWRARCLITI